MHVVYPKEADWGIWGGEGVVKGFYKPRIFYGRYQPQLFMPRLIKSQVYSEIFDVYLSVTVTERALSLFDRAMGFDNYILKTPVQDLKSQLALRLRRKMLISLAKEDYYPNDPERHAYIKEKYADCVIPLQEAEWFGLTLEEAIEKLKYEENEQNPVLPLKFQLRKELIEFLKKKKAEGQLELAPAKKSLLSTITTPIYESGLAIRRLMRGEHLKKT